MTITVEQLVEIAEGIELSDPIDWGMLKISEHDAFVLMATSVLESYEKTDHETRDMIMLATVVKLVVENFTLNMFLLDKSNQG